MTALPRKERGGRTVLRGAARGVCWRVHPMPHRPDELKAIHEALQQAFPTRPALARFVHFHLGSNLEAIASPGGLSQTVFELLTWAESQGRIEELIAKAREANPGNLSLREFRGAAERRVRGFVAGDHVGAEQRYKLLREIGHGGFATVWEAHDLKLKLSVAIKVLHMHLNTDQSVIERFESGVRKMQRLEHPGVVQVLAESQHWDGCHYFVMRLVEGGDLRQAVSFNPLGAATAVKLIAAIGEVLAYSHQRGVVHGDVKPANILLTSAFEPKLTDFDLARGGDSTEFAARGTVMGSALYTAPEVLHEAAAADERADVFSLGCTALYVLLGREFKVSEWMRPASALADVACPARVKAAVVRAMDPDPAARFATMREFIDALSKPSPVEVEKRWQITLEGRPQGPYSIEDLRGFMEQGLVTAETPVWDAQAAAWLPLRYMEHLASWIPVDVTGNDPLIGKAIANGKYRVVDSLGEDGTSKRYRGLQKIGDHTRQVMIKTLTGDVAADPIAVSRFIREAGTVSALEHPNTIRLYDSGQLDDGRLFSVTELVQGESLARVIARGALPLPRVAHMLSQVCGSLQEAHERGVVHRDIQPEHIVLTSVRSRADFVKVSGFNLAERDGADAHRRLEQVDFLAGTPPYMSPDQFMGKVLGPSSDVYSFAVVVYEMLTGKLPFEANTPWEWATAHLTMAPLPFREADPRLTIPDDVEATVFKGLAKNPSERHASMQEFADDFARACAEGRE